MKFYPSNVNHTPKVQIVPGMQINIMVVCYHTEASRHCAVTMGLFSGKAFDEQGVCLLALKLNGDYEDIKEIRSGLHKVLNMCLY